MIRVGFPLIGGREWTGGYNYLLNLVKVLSARASSEITPVMLFGPEASAEDRAPFEEIEGVVVISDPAFGAVRRARGLGEAVLLGLDGAAAAALHRHKIDVVFEAARYYGWRLQIPAIAWIPDFQHRYLTHLFSPKARFRRALGFNAQIWSGRQVMLSSEDARTDCERFHPASRGRTTTVPFAIPRDEPIPAEVARAVADRHGLPDVYFYLPNQFWLHKNHEVVIEALALLKAKGRSVVVAASGGQIDPRDPEHFKRLMHRASQLGVAGLFRPLGLIDYADVPMLMRAAAALINPSLFEGWSTTVEEAKTIGTPMILSDLRVHREQTSGFDAVYFEPGSPKKLAELLADFTPASAEVSTARAAAAAARSQESAARFSADFVNLAKRAANGRRRPG